MYNLGMLDLVSLEPVDYLVIGHLSHDITPDGARLGGTPAYSALTARAMGLRVGIVTAWARGAQNNVPSLDVLKNIPMVSVSSEKRTTFNNIPTENGRQQYLYHLAAPIPFTSIPEVWRHAAIIHIGPIAQEVEPLLPSGFSPSLLGLTPQGWLRAWDEKGEVKPCKWPEAASALHRAGAAVLSIEDVDGDEDQIEAMALASRVLAVTEGPAGARLYWHGDLRRFSAPVMERVDDTGAGDIFAAAFFVRLYMTRDPWEAARFATHLAARSVTRPGLEGIPTPEEIQACLTEVLP